MSTTVLTHWSHVGSYELISSKVLESYRIKWFDRFWNFSVKRQSTLQLWSHKSSRRDLFWWPGHLHLHSMQYTCPSPQHSEHAQKKQNNEQKVCHEVSRWTKQGWLKKPPIVDYWSTNPVLHTTFASKLMKRDRFWCILAFFHLSSSATFSVVTGARVQL